jgi:hypothetical protein
MGRITVLAVSPTLRVAMAGLMDDADDVVFIDQDCVDVGGTDLHVEIIERFAEDRCAAAEARLASAGAAAVVVLDVDDRLGRPWAVGLHVGAVLSLDSDVALFGAALAAVRAGLRLGFEPHPWAPHWVDRLTAAHRRWLEHRLDHGWTVAQLAASERVSQTTMKDRLRELRRTMGATTLDEAAEAYQPWRGTPASAA